MKTNAAIVIPNWNGKDRLKLCLDSVFSQSTPSTVIVIDNGSTDGSVEYLQLSYPKVEIIAHPKNLGFAGGVNSGIEHAKSMGADYIALLNNDAVLDKDWLKELLKTLRDDSSVGVAACKLLSFDKKHIDSTGDYYTVWGLPMNRQRDVAADKAVNKSEFVWGACAGAALYRTETLYDAGLFDEDFFAYHEDGDLNFRIQLAGWKVMYNPRAEAYHATGSTSSKIKGFTTYHTFKNLPLLFWKDVPTRLLPKMLPRFMFVYSTIYVSSLLQGRAWPATKGFLQMLTLLPKKLVERRRIQKNRRVSVDYINSILVHDLPPNAAKLRRLRKLFTGKG